jgi:hypothetical protein
MRVTDCIRGRGASFRVMRFWGVEKHGTKWGWERFATHVDPLGGFRKGSKDCDWKVEGLNKYVHILTREFAVNLGSGLSWGKATGPFFCCYH